MYEGKDTVPAKAFLSANGFDERAVGLIAVPHLRDCYNLFHSTTEVYSGIVRKESSNEVALSSVPKTEAPLALLYFNRDGYSAYCKKYREYWDWVEKRNEERYKTTVSHGKNYDSKNMMHVFRLLLMAKEIATEKRINVQRSDRAFLLDIKAGKYAYDDLVKRAEILKDELPELYAASDLPEAPDEARVNKLLVKMREEIYQS